MDNSWTPGDWLHGSWFHWKHTSHNNWLLQAWARALVQKTENPSRTHTHTNCPSPVVSFWRPSNPPPAALLAGCRNGLSLWLFQSVKEKNLMIVDICWSSPCELSWSLACGNHHLTLCTHKRSWRVGCHGNSGSFGYGCVSWRQHMLNFLLCPISALQIFPWITFFI